ncbi:MAG TPA: glycosyltransferase family 4 protein [Flavobacterium sp.]|uniref:glycosyltransferase family 4 protein n=1 Tax=unclassified Flavobacterium TaxID=196869 RepID=UPI0025BF6CC0|nr:MULTISPECIES: glycosyltransferase family 4 protein [unclassified Flavobacterium]HRE79333.1 glycosyltransferase family 4 protein [Flavobacterium sp.]
MNFQESNSINNKTKPKVIKLLYIGNKLLKHGFSATSIETLGALLENENCKVVYASSIKNKLFRLLDMFFKTLFNAHKVNYVLIDTYSTTNFWYAFIISQLCRILNKQYIPILRGGDLPKRLKSSPLLSRLIFSNSLYNIAPSQYLFTVFKEHKFNNLKLIPNTIEINNYNFQKKIKLEPKILWVRSLSEIYNPKMAIDVLRMLKSNFPDAELCMIGQEKDVRINDLLKYANSFSLNVTFTGKLSKQDWIKLSENYDIFINTTHFDNTPVSLIEALALGLPVVSTNVGGIPYLVKDRESAILVNDSDSQAMANAINELIENPELAQKLTSNGRKLVEQFDWQIVKKQWKEILK